jgi:hypothetical protein
MLSLSEWCQVLYCMYRDDADAIFVLHVVSYELPNKIEMSLVYAIVNSIKRVGKRNTLRMA